MLRPSYFVILIAILSTVGFASYQQQHSELAHDRKIIPSDGEWGDRFGSSVALAGESALIGTEEGIAAGSAYLFSTASGDRIAKLTAVRSKAEDYFASAIGLSVDIIVIGCRFDDEHGIDSGSVYLFDRNTRQRKAILLASDGSERDHFGYSVGVSSENIVVGAPRDDDKGESSGAIYVFDIRGQQTNKLTPGDGAQGDHFGHSVDIYENMAIVGARNDGDKGKDSGSAYIFNIKTGQLIVKLLPTDGVPGDQFGTSVAIYDTVAIVGVPNSSSRGERSGSAYLFDVNSGRQIAKLVPNDLEADDRFGISVARWGRFAVVGAPGRGSKGPETGVAYVFDVMSQQMIAKLHAGDGAAGDAFGQSVAMSDSSVIVGAPGDDDKGRDSGSVYVFTIPEAR
ncbi:MAG: FG-GAP repeat protein [Phycisphaerales bacterium]